jgi:hypothetical protein
LQSRWEKLRLGYWRRIQAAKSERALAIIADMRRRQVTVRGKVGRGSWMRGTMELMYDRGLAEHWHSPYICADMEKEHWKLKVYENVERHHDGLRQKRMRQLSSVTMYNNIKQWGRVSEDNAEFKGEVWQRGALVCERYLDDVKQTTACKLKLMCGANTLPVLVR